MKKEIKYNNFEWKLTSIVFPALWVAMLIKYSVTEDHCFRLGLKVACGGQAILMLVGWFVFCMAWPCIYFFKIRPAIRESEKGKLDQEKSD